MARMRAPSSTSNTSSTTSLRSAKDSGTGTRTAIPSAMVAMHSVDWGLPSRSDSAIAGAPAGQTAITRVAGECAFIHRPMPDALQLQRIRRVRGEDYKLETALARGIGHSLSEIAGRGAHQLRRTRRKLGHEVIGAASLEGTNRVYRLDLENQTHAERTAQLLAQELGSVQENRIDGVNCFLNPLERKPGLENRMGSQSVPLTPPGRTTGELSPLRETDHFALCRSFWVFPFARIRQCERILFGQQRASQRYPVP